MLWKCIVSESNHCEIDQQRSSTRDLHNAIIHLVGRGRLWVTGTGVCSNSIESATNTNRKFALAWHGLLFVSSVCWSVHVGTSLTFLHIQIREQMIRARTDTIWYDYSSIHNGRYQYWYEYSLRRGVPATYIIRPGRSLRECSLYAMGGTLHPRLKNVDH